MNHLVALIASATISVSCSASQENGNQRETDAAISACAITTKRLVDRLQFLDEKIELAQEVSTDKVKGVLSKSTVEREREILDAYDADRRLACIRESRPGFELRIATTLMRLDDAEKRSKP